MDVIWKYPLKVTDGQKVCMPKSAQILCVQIEMGQLCLWALVDEENDTEERFIAIHGTGHPIPTGGRKYIGTVQTMAGSLVWHVFELR